jgi:hypothetical protein
MTPHFKVANELSDSGKVSERQHRSDADADTVAAGTGQIAGAAVTTPVVHIPVDVRRIVSIRRSIKTGATWAHPRSAVIPTPTQLRLENVDCCQL